MTCVYLDPNGGVNDAKAFENYLNQGILEKVDYPIEVKSF
jgi:hypothetical protein